MGSSYSHISSETDVGKELEQDDTQPEKRQRIVDEQSMVVYGQQGSSSNSQLTSQSVTLYNNSAEYQRMILTEKLNRLFARRDDVVRELENAEIQPGKKRRAEVQHWLTEVGRKEQKIQTMIQDGQGSTCNSNIALHIESFIKEVDELVQRGEFSKGLVLLDQESTRLPLLLDTKPVGTSFQQNAKRILERLQNHEHHIIGVYGMGGVGKTTLLTHIHDQLLQDSNLSHIIGHVYWVTVSQNCPVRKLQDDIAKVLGLAGFQEDDERKRAAILHKRLAARGRTVLILDDMWEHVSGSKVGIPLENSNCKIILSTRQYDVCRQMKCKDFVIKAETLKEDEARDLFVEKLGHYDTLEEEAKKIAREIAKECGGLPLAIATMARSMTEIVDIYEWKTALDDLKSARGQANMEEEVIPILRYSYDRLNGKTVQECFLSCILYGEDEKIKRTTLIDLWINEGLLDEIESRTSQVATGHVILNKLESSCLLESVLNYSNEKCVKMHDLIREMGIIITKEHFVFIAEARKQLKQVPKEEKWSEDLVKVSLMYNEINEIPSGMAPMTPNLTVLMLNGNPLEIIPDSFFVHMRALTLLDLSWTLIKRVPESVSDLENLRGLLLFSCFKLNYVPSVAKLTKLRNLDLSYSRELLEAPSGLERLKCIEKISYIPWKVSNVIGFNELIQSLTLLVHYRFWIRGFDLKNDVLGTFYRYTKVVQISWWKFGEDKSTLLVPNTLEYLSIEKCGMKGSCLGDVVQSVGEATGLKALRLIDCRGLESISGTQQGTPVLWGTSQLERLYLKVLPDLRSIAKPGVPHSFSHLQYLYIVGCPKLKVALPMTCTDQLHLPNLESIEVEECEEVEEIFETNRATLSNFLVVLPKLKKVKLWSLPKLKVIFPTAEQLQLPCLSSIKVRECEEVEEIFGSNQTIIPNLRKVELTELPKLKVIFPFTEKLHLPNLESIYVRECKDLKKIFGSNEAIIQSSSILSRSLPNLQELKLEDLPKIKVILPFIKELPNLRTITVTRCGEVEEIFGSNQAIIPNLMQVELVELPKLKVIFPTAEQLQLPCLYNILVKDCEEVEEIFGSNQAIIPNLMKMKLIELPKLKVIFPTAEQLQLPCLRSIKVIYCEEVEEIFGSNTAIIPNLKKLELDELHKLKVIFPTAEKLHLPNLESIYVSGCKDLREIFGLNKASLSSHILSFSLNKVTTIFLIDLPKIKVIFPFIEELHLPNLKYITVRRCEEVVEVFETNKTILSSFEPNKTILSSPILSRSLPNLLELELEDLPKIKVILPFIEELHLPNLEIITVRRCEEVVEVFETNKAPPYKPNLSLPKLQDLYLVDLPKLGSIYRGLLFCPNLVIRPESISDCPKLTLWRLPGAVTSTEPWSPMESHYIRSFNQQPACLPHSDAPLSMMESHYIRSFNQQETLLLTDQINSTNQPASLHHSDDDTDDDDTQWGASLSL